MRVRRREWGTVLHRGTEERPELTEENRVEQDANPSAAAAAPPFDKGGRAFFIANLSKTVALALA